MEVETLGLFTDFLSTFSVDKACGNFSLIIVRPVDTSLLFMVVTLLPVCTLSWVFPTLLSPVQMGSGLLLRFPLGIHGGLAISLLERIPSGLLVSAEDGNSNSDDAESGGMEHVDVL